MVGLAGGTCSLTGTALAQAWSHSSIRSGSTEVAPGNGTANAGFTIAGEATEGAGAQAGGGRSIQRNSAWAKLKANTRTFASVSGLANSHAVWGGAKSTNTSVNAALFGQTVFTETKQGSTSCVSQKTQQKTGPITERLPIWGVTLADVVDVSLGAQILGTAGYGFVAEASSNPLGGFADLSSSASNGGHATVTLRTDIGAVFGGVFELTAGVNLELVRANITGVVNDRMIVNGRNDLDVSWNNLVGASLASAGGSVTGRACAVFCASHTFFRWNGFSKGWEPYKDSGVLRDQSF